MKLKMFVCIVFLTMATSDSFGGWIFTEGGGESIKTSYIQDNRIKIVEPDQIQIFDLNNNMIIIANPNQKSFWTGTPEEFADYGKKTLENINETIDQQMAWMPAREKESFKENMLRQIRKDANMPPRVEVRPSPDKDKVAGYDVRKYEILVNGQLKFENWTSENIPVGREFDVNRFGNMMRIFQSGFGHGEGSALWSPEVVNLIARGWVLRTVYFEEEGAIQVDEVSKIENTPLPPSVFEIPQNYSRMAITEIFGK